MKNCIRKLAPVFNTNRMVKDYAEKYYIPAAQRGQQLMGEGLKRSIDLARAKDRLHTKWNGVRIVGVHTSGNGHYKVGQNMEVEALLDLADLNPNEVLVQLYAGAINATGEIEQPSAMPMKYVKQLGPGRHVFTGTIECRTSGRQGYAVRVLPGYADMATPFEPGLITWN
jgi:starch phosphorylase